MAVFAEWKERRADRKRFRKRSAELEKKLVVQSDAFFNATTPEDSTARFLELKATQIRLKRLQQTPLLYRALKQAIDVPAEMYSKERSETDLLSPKGEAWLRRAISERRMQLAKDWSGIVMPLLSLLLSSTIAILGLLVALKKK